MFGCIRLRDYSSIDPDNPNRPICIFRKKMLDKHCTLECKWCLPMTVHIDAYQTATRWHCALLAIAWGLLNKGRGA